MAQISRNNGFRQNASPPSGAVPAKDVDKEEALQMEAEALAKLRKDRVPGGSSSSRELLSSTRQRAPAYGKQDQDLMVFPESEGKKRAEEKLRTIDVEKLTQAELEKLLLDDSFESRKAPKPLSLPATPVLSPSVSTQYYLQPPLHGGHWTTGLHGPVPSALSPVYSASYQKQSDPFQNGLNPAGPTYRSREPVYLSLPGRSPYISYRLPSITPFHIRGSLPLYPPAVTPGMAKLFDKIASTSEFLKNSSTETELSTTKTAVPAVQPSQTSSDISKFDWLDLDPLSKPPKVDTVESICAEDSGKIAADRVAEDPWDAVLLEEKPPETCHAERRNNGKTPCGATVTRSQSLNIRSSDSALAKPQGQTSQVDNGTNSILPAGRTILQEIEGQDEEVAAFCQQVTKLRTNCPATDHATNPGFVLSPVMLQRNISGENASVKVCIEIEGFQQPVTFTCDVSSPVELIIMQALCWVHDDLNQIDIGSYILKVCGQEEVLQNKHCLGSHEYIQACRKWDTEIKLQLLSHSTICRDLARTVTDDETPTDLKKYLYHIEKPFREPIQRCGLEELLEAYHEEVDACLKNEMNRYRAVDLIIKNVRKICSALDGVETPAITESVKRLKRVVNLPRSKSAEVTSKSANGMTKTSVDGSLQLESPIQESITLLTAAIYDLLQLHFSSCNDPGRTVSAPAGHRNTKEACVVSEHLQFTLFAAHGIPAGWVSSFEKYYLTCSLTHNGRDLFKPVQSKKVGTYKSFFYLIKWDELIIFPIQISQLPLESILHLSLCGILNQSSGNSPDTNRQRKGPEMLGQVSLPLFDFRRLLTCGTKLLSLWTSFPTSPASGTVSRRGTQMERIVLQVDFPSPATDIVYTAPQPANTSAPHSLEALEKHTKTRLLSVLSKDSIFGLSKEDKVFLWEMRYRCLEDKNCLPKVLASAPHWDWASLSEIYSLLHQWPPLSPVNALALLDSRFADQEVRSVAVNWIEGVLTDDELADFLPQFVQALKYEIYLDSSLVRFLLTRALGNIRIAHYLYWLLKDALNDPHFGVRYEHILGALLSLVGRGLREELEKQSRLVQLLGVVAEKVRHSGGSVRQVVLQEGMERVQSFFLKNKCRLPLSPSLVAKELNIKACSFFSSNAVPLKVTMVNADPRGEEINAMFKVGEDLRQDMLALQMIKIMDKIWLQEGLDLRMVLFKCLSTGKDRGMVELVSSSDTLRKIQVEYGVTGSFKDKPLAEWLRKYNPSEEDYEKASENFIYSCAGCCVATYVLGICDRHNDNIMLRSTGHMFHIDFGKFLGHAQMFGSFKRDRAPFVLTSDMAYVINGGEKPTSRFQLFVDLCCQAYNLIRKHASLFLNLLSLMLSSGLPELNSIQDLKYVLDALQPQTTDAEATIFFTRLIESSLGSVATKFNFFIHNLAQLRFSGLPSNDEPILSFSPKTYSLKQDGRIREASVFTYHKKYNPDKHYIYVVRVLREGQDDSTFVFRTFDEFQELHNKLSILFPLWKLPGFPNKMVLGRTHVKDVAAKRKVELNSYIQSLMDSSTEVAECDLVYTFFHPLLRDDRNDGVDAIAKPTAPLSPVSGKVGGEVKLSISYRNGTLFIMVMHIKDLVPEDGTDPNPYVKTYLLPDPHKTSKRKTKISRKTCNPTFNEMLIYCGFSMETLEQRELQLSVLSAESLRENYFLGGVTLSLKDFNLNQETINWHKLTAVPYL
ncbi:phosphatidylinositol 4-phosphate 3-kinase C2 domain-containing subunit alpha [Rhinatrema bivittatum]|uniref:phosphatidylinositol 4-phosphate 3-kinase C2 domain-containing subunit alpha n=1 Tax=Rhinatrema bivittatum TaxID=194408 RepID=UPI001127824A|nr:phosphatidylinositol 4-phosphate 3-kinase C2 domain-containing subunit alpha [Rhinatrema bivittatum]XP_029438013.1 phosphatidylinositol 4-phosphate 3-kinase C2 domain-containing subunit alpha [Rhinatrema bivittatum]XP_029438015.1 phosphatidylinositol 4-phosphate 3-kinase C2 domain-containing subunit alpha [Rhinatrema bivittatum]XP_029438016.1 phosphatidylinositol 4-phosphate 3-kinase C2 domain-containing subunit alpha [Rhinatrema bivittatum]